MLQSLFVNSVVRPGLRLIEFSAAQFANRGNEGLPGGVGDMVKAGKLARYCGAEDSTLLDVGCGSGRRLREMSLFRPDVRMTGIDLHIRSGGPIPGATEPELQTFDGWEIPFEDNSFDVSLICYALHHMPAEQSDAVLREMVRVTTRRLLILEDSMEEWTSSYRLRNWAHLVESNLLYAQESDEFDFFSDISGFLTYDEWRKRLGNIDGVESIEIDELSGIHDRRHHTLFVAELD